MLKAWSRFLLLITVSFVLAGNDFQEKGTGNSLDCDKAVIRNEMKDVLQNLFENWYPLCIDTVYGGYFSDINYKWELDGPQNKMIVTQARHIWEISNTALAFPEYKKYLYAARHGVEFLREKMWDKEQGGFFNVVNRSGEPAGYGSWNMKTAYGQAFAIYGLSSYYELTSDSTALNLAKKTFHWLENHSYDTVNGGYFQFIDSDGKPLEDGFRDTPPKDQNSTLHLLEAFSELYNVWPDSLLGERLSSLLEIFEDKIITEKGCMDFYFYKDWSPFKYKEIELGEVKFEYDYISFGHDIETAYLIWEAYSSLGGESNPGVIKLMKKMIDHTIKNGWDSELGGIFDRGYIYPGESKVTIIRRSKEWWAQVETLNSLLLINEVSPDDSMNYFGKFCEQWKYCETYLIDPEYGGWYMYGADGREKNKLMPKGTIWKAEYHTSRSLVNCIKMLEKD